VVVFAGTSHSNNGGLTVQFDTLRAAVYQTNNYNRFDPATWGTGSAPIASWTLRAGANATDVAPGPGLFNFTAGQWNNAGISLVVGTRNQAQFLLNEDPAGSLGILNPNYWNMIAPPPPPGNQFIGKEGLGSAVDETLQTADPTLPVNSATGVNQLNAIFQTLLPGGGLAGFGFASGFGGVGNPTSPIGTYAPQNASSGQTANTLDGQFSLGTQNGIFSEFSPTTTAVPEPATLAVFAGVMSFGGLVYRRRRNAKA